jgi:hypothetical protein
MPTDDSYPTISQLGGRIVDLRRLVYPDNKNWSATNPSIGKHPQKNQYAIAIRSSNYVITDKGVYQVTEGSRIRAEVWFSMLDKNLKIKDLKKVDLDGLDIDFTRGLEDPKLFWRDGSWQFTCVILEGEHTPIARMGVACLDSKGRKVVHLEKFPGVEYKRPEKNWMVPYEPNPNFDFVYGPNQVIKAGVLHSWLTDCEELSMLRGTSNLHSLGDETYLSVMHKKLQKHFSYFDPSTFGSYVANNHNYVHVFARHDSEGFITEISKPFQFYKPGIEFASGLVEKGDDFVVSFGREDVSSHLAFLPKDVVLKSLQPVKY